MKHVKDVATALVAERAIRAARRKESQGVPGSSMRAPPAPAIT